MLADNSWNPNRPNIFFPSDPTRQIPSWFGMGGEFQFKNRLLSTWPNSNPFGWVRIWLKMHGLTQSNPYKLWLVRITIWPKGTRVPAENKGRKKPKPQEGHRELRSVFTAGGVRRKGLIYFAEARGLACAASFSLQRTTPEASKTIPSFSWVSNTILCQNPPNSESSFLSVLLYHIFFQLTDSPSHNWFLLPFAVILTLHIFFALKLFLGLSFFSSFS